MQLRAVQPDDLHRGPPLDRQPPDAPPSARVLPVRLDRPAAAMGQPRRRSRAGRARRPPGRQRPPRVPNRDAAARRIPPRLRTFPRAQRHLPLPAKSPAGLLERIVGGWTNGTPDRALDRLTAINKMQAWPDDQDKQVAIGARLAGCTWLQIGQAIGANTDLAIQRWGQMIARYQHAGLLPPDE
jgi:hypothetical protein